MMSCVNPNCNLPISTFSDGRLFHFEILSISVVADDNQKSAFDEVPNREGVHFWLCGACAADMTLVLEPIGGLQLVPIDRSLERHALGQALENSTELLGQNSRTHSMQVRGALSRV
jgi:hypothetical protein